METMPAGVRLIHLILAYKTAFFIGALYTTGDAPLDRTSSGPSARDRCEPTSPNADGGPGLNFH